MVVYVLLWSFFKDDLTKFIESQVKNILKHDMFINRKRKMLNWKFVYFMEIGYFIKSEKGNEQEKLLIEYF